MCIEGKKWRYSMKITLKKILIFPIYLCYYVITEWILALGTKDPWNKMWEWAEK